MVVRSVVAYTLGGMSLLSGDIVGASRAFVEASEAGRSAGNIHVAVPALSNLAELQVVQGQLRQAAETCRQALELAIGQHGQPLAVAASAYSEMGSLLYEWNDLEAAAHRVTKAFELSEQWGNVDMLVGNCVTLARVLHAQGDVDGALKALQRADQLIRGRATAPPVAARVAAHRAWLWLQQGDIAAASRWAQESRIGPSLALRASPGDGLGYMGEFERITLARVLIAQGEFVEALARLAQLLEAAETQTVSTVKSHVNHIHGKLGVKSRTQAVAQARALGLL